MGVFSKLAGVVGNLFQLGGPSGPAIKNNSGVIEARNAGDTTYVVVRGAAPVGDNDFTTKTYVDTIARPFIVTAQANAVSALIANSGVEHYIVVSAAGTGAAAAYVAGTVLWDDGSGSGNVQILGPTTGQPIFVTTSLVGGTFTFSANQEYIWTGATWQNVAPSVSGATYTIDFAIGTAASQSSVSQIPANAIILSSDVTITTPYSVGTTIKVGQTGTTNLLQDTTDSFPTVAGTYEASQRTSWGGSPLAVLVTIAGAPSVGAGFVTVLYSVALA